MNPVISAPHANSDLQDVTNAGKSIGESVKSSTEKAAIENAQAIAGTVDQSLKQGRKAISESIDRSISATTKAHSMLSEALTPEVRAMFPTIPSIVEGLFNLQLAYAGYLRRSVDRTYEAPQELLKCRSSSEMSAIQKKFLTESISDLRDQTQNVMEISSRMTQQAFFGLSGQLKEAYPQTAQ
jgi:hypothetical protein